MTIFRQSLAALAISALFICAPAVKGDEWNKRTVITIDQAIQLPTTVLQPGTYVFKLLDSQSDRHIVQVFNKEENHLITTVLAIPNYRLEPRGKTVFTFWEVPAGEPPAVRAWFYPGDNYGQEFAYRKNRATEVAAYAKTSVPTSEAQSAEEMKSMPVTSIDESGKSAELDRETYTAQTEPPPPPPAATEPAPQTAPQVPEPAPPEPQPAPAPIPRELPHTATQWPLVGLLGVVSLCAFAVLKLSARA